MTASSLYRQVPLIALAAALLGFGLAFGLLAPPTRVALAFGCGDGVCSGQEDPTTCPDDCTTYPGCVGSALNGICEASETFATCPDCMLATCGNNICDFPETTTTCPIDCTGSCGNDMCEPSQGESSYTCPADCGCGDGLCINPETEATCPADCASVCGDAACTHDENFGSCPADCPTCGNNTCDTGETAQNCRDDCAANLLINGSFEDDADADLKPDGWRGGGLKLTALDGRDDAETQDGAYSFRFSGKGSKKLKQTVLLAGAAGQDLQLSLWTREAGIGLEGLYRVKVTVWYVGGGKSVLYLDLPTGDHDWAQHTLTIPALKATKKLAVMIQYKKYAGTVWLDDVLLTMEAVSG